MWTKQLSSRKLGGPRLSLVYSPKPSPDGSNDHNHASIKTVIKLGVGA